MSFNQQQGFTLMELLLAMGISAMIAALAYAGINTSIGASEALEEEVQSLAAMQHAMTVIERDVRQIVLRSSSDEVGNTEAIFAGGKFSPTLLEFTRAGYSNALGLPRSELLRVNYTLKAGGLYRQQWTVLDRVSAQAGMQEVLVLDRLDELDLQFLESFTPVQNSLADDSGAFSLQGTWVQSWRSAALGPDNAEPLPLAIQFTFKLPNSGTVVRIYEIPGA